MNLIIAGGRHFDDFSLVRSSYVSLGLQATCIFSGKAKGADALGEQLAKELGIPVTPFAADWDDIYAKGAIIKNGKYGKYNANAGRQRNEDMAEWADCLLAFWDGESTGTKHMIDYARGMGLIVHVVMYDKEKKLEEEIHVILDFETLNVTPDSAVLSLAVLAFNPAVLKPFEELVDDSLRVKFKLDGQAPRRSINNDTVEWWKHEDQKHAFELVVKNDGTEVDVSLLDNILKSYLDKMGYVFDKGKVWARGNAFDNPILDDIYNQYGWAKIMPFWAYRCVRTEIDAITPYWDDQHKGYGYIREELFGKPIGMVKHIETHDVSFDVMSMQYTHLKLMEKLR